MPHGDITEQQVAELGVRYEAIRMGYFEQRGDAESYLEAEMAFNRWSQRANDMFQATNRPAAEKFNANSTVSFMAKKGWLPPITK